MSEIKIKPIPTKYNGITFRSKLEAEWAKFFDSIGIKYIYEPDGYELSDGTKYLPDFYLPDAHQWFEVKGVMTDIDMHKILMLVKDSGKEAVIGYNNGDFQHINLNKEHDKNIVEVMPKNESVLNECSYCGGLSFLNNIYSYECRCNGCYDGDHYCNWIMWGDGDYGSFAKWIDMSRIDVMQNEKPKDIPTKKEDASLMSGAFLFEHDEGISIQKDYSEGGVFNLCDYDVLKPVVKSWLINQKKYYLYDSIPWSEFQKYFRNKRYKKIIELRRKGWPDHEIQKQYKFSDKMMRKTDAEISIILKDRCSIWPE